MSEDQTPIIMATILGKLDEMIADATDDEEMPIADPKTTAEVVAERERANHPLVDFPDRHRRDLTLYGDDWLVAYRKALALCEAGGIVVAYGKRGTGKTQIACEIARNAYFQNTHFPPVSKNGFNLPPKIRPCLYYKAMDIFIDLKNGFGRPGEPSEKQVISRLVDAVFLVIDEAHVRGETKYEDDKLTHIIDKRYDAMRATMLITNLEKHEFAAQLSPSIKNRMQEIGGGIECNWESYRKQKP